MEPTKSQELLLHQLQNLSLGISSYPFNEQDSLRKKIADVIAKEVLSTEDIEWTYTFGKSSPSELYVHVMRHMLLTVFSHWQMYRETVVARLLQAFLKGRFECLTENQADRGVDLLGQEVEYLLERELPDEGLPYVSGNFRDWDRKFIVELCRGLPHALIPSVMKKLHGDPSSWSNIYRDMLNAATQEGDVEQIHILLKDARFRCQNDGVLVYIERHQKKIAVAATRALLSNKELKPDTIGYALQIGFYKPDELETSLKLRKLFLDDPRTTSKMLTRAFLQQSFRCNEVLERQIINHPKADLKGLLKKAATCIWDAEPFFPPLWKAILEDPRLPSDAVNVALYKAARNGHSRIVPLLLADHRISFCSIFEARWQMPEYFKEFEPYKDVAAKLDKELVRRCTGPTVVSVGLFALVMLRCNK